MAGKTNGNGGKTSAKSTPVKRTPMKKPRDKAGSTPCSPAGGRGTPRRAAASGAVERMKKMAVKTEDTDTEMDEAFDGDEDYDRAPTGTSSKASTPRKTYRARVRSAPTTPTSRRSPGKGTPRKLKRESDTASDISGDSNTSSRVQLAEDLPVIGDIGEMFVDLVSRVPGMETFLTAMKRPIRVATMCSGTESPLLALDKIGDATEKLYGTRLPVDHVFSCEIEPFKQAYIERNFAPPILFRDIRELGGDQATTAYGAKIDVPHDVDMLVAGTSCVDYSNLNNERKGLDAQGESGQTFRGMMNWIRKSQPPIVILENVCNAPWDQVAKRFNDEGYHAQFMRVDTKRFYIPHTRTRVYLFACKADDATLVEQWKANVKALERPASATLEAFLFDSDDPRVHEGRRMLARPGEDSTRANTDWGRCESRHQRARLDEGLGQRRPFTHWDGGCTMPDFAWNDWGKAQTDRVLDLMDIDYLRLAQLDIDSMHKTLVWNLSQNVDRTTGSVAPGICPCLTPSMVPFVTNRGGPLVGIEALSLQGIPVDDLLLTRETENQMSDLAGNAMTTTVVGACMLAALTLMTDNLVAKKHKTVRRALKLEDSSASTQTVKGTLTVVQAAAAQKAKVVGQEKLVKRPLDLGMKPMAMKHLLDKANRSARLCVCEGETGTTANDALVMCGDCFHTCCIKCCGRPEHNYAKHAVKRILPEDFKEELKNSLPMHMKIDMKTVKFDKPIDVLPAVWDDWQQALKTVGEADFLFRGMKRTNVWRVFYSCSSEDQVRLELRIAPNAAEWLIFVDPSIKKGKPHDMFLRPIMRMRLDSSGKSALDGVWEVFHPETQAVPVTIRGSGTLEDSWQVKLGMQAPSVGAKPWALKRWNQYEVKISKEDAKKLDRDISGTYQLHDKCDAAQSSLHKRVGGPAKDGREMYFFMDPRRNQRGDCDYFVFADNHRRLMYGEDRMETAHVDPFFRPDEEEVHEVFVKTFGTWTSLSPKVVLMPAVADGAVVRTPPVNSVPTQGDDACSKAVAIMRCSVPLAEVDAEFWPKDEYTTLRLDKSHATFQRLEWFTSRMELPKVVEKWNELGDHKSVCSDYSCPRCAPTPPSLQWSRQVGSQKVQAREDPQQAAQYEQALKCRPAPFVVQWTREKLVGNLMIAANPATLVHRALALVAPSSVRGIKSTEPKMSWRIVRHDDRPMDNFGEFELKSNRHDKKVSQPPNWSKKYPLRPEQLRSLGWMIQQEMCEEPFLEEEVCENVLPALGLRMDGMAQVSKVVRGGIVADQVGYGKTAISIGVILANQLKFPTPKQAKVEAPVKAIPTKATLVIAPSQLLRQWPREVEKFSARGSLNTVVLKTMSDLNSLTARDVMEADVVIVASTLFRSSLYFERLAQLAGRPSLPDPKSTNQARHFSSVYRDTITALEDQVMRLTDKKQGISEVAKHVRHGVATLTDMAVAAAPKRLKGAKLIEATVKAGGEGFEYIEAMHNEKQQTTDKENASRPLNAPQASLSSTPNKPKKTPTKKTPTKKTPTKKTPTKKTPIKSPIRASARNTPRKSYAEDEFETDDEISDWDESDESDSEEFAQKATPKRKRVIKRTSSVEVDADGNKDHWGLESAQVEYDWRDIKSVPVELFHWRRVIVDEFTYLKPSDKAVVLGLQSESRWCLSGTPPVGEFADIKGTAALLGINLGSDEVPRYSKAEITKVETFQFFKEKPTQQWHKRRWEVAQQFLNRYMRQNIAEIDEIKFKEDVVDVNLRPAERAIYLELDHYLQSMDMKAKKKKRGGSEGDRDARLAAVLSGSSTAEEALLKRVAHFELDDESGTALRTCQDIVNVRKGQQDACLVEFGEAVLKARAMYAQVASMDGFDDEEKKVNSFVRWEEGVQGEGIGDPTATDLLRLVLKEQTDEKAQKTAHLLQTRPPVGSRVSVLWPEENKWFDGEVRGYSGQWKQKALMVYDDGDRREEDLTKVNWKVLQAAPETPGSVTTKSNVSKKQKNASYEDKLWELREHTHGLRKLQKELVGRVRSLRFFQSVRDLQQAKLSDSITCQVCAQTKKGAKSVCAKSLSGVLSTCGHVGCLECLKTNAENQECGVEGCDCATRDSSVVTADSLGTEGASKGKNNGKTDGGVGVHGSKIIDLVAHIKSIPEDERVLVFVQFTDLMQQVSSALNEAGIKTLKLKGSVHQQTAALDEFQKEDLKKHDARVLLLLSRDESASGANLTTANHAIFVHPLLTNTAQEYIASETQAIGRIRRYGQQREVRIWRFIVRDSIDSEILSQRSANALQQK